MPVRHCLFLLVAASMAAPGILACGRPQAVRQDVENHHDDRAFTCDDVAPGAKRPPYGCFNIATVSGLHFPDSVVYWHLSVFPTRAAAAAAAARSSSGTVIEEDGKVWLNEFGSKDRPVRGGKPVATVGPLVLPPARSYSAVFSYAVMRPGQGSRVHTHPGPEGWYMLAGQQCLETSVGVFRGSTGQTVVAPPNVPMELYIPGTEVRRSLVVVIHDGGKRRGERSEWRPTGVCRS